MASCARDSMYKNGALFECWMREGLPSVGFLDADTESGIRWTLDERDRNPNDEISVPSPTATTATREELPVNFGLVIWN